MIIIHGYRVTTLVLYILLNVLVRTGEYNHLPVSPLAGYVFPRVVCARPVRRQSQADSGAALRKVEAASSDIRIDYHLLFYSLAIRVFSCQKVCSVNITLLSI